MSNEKKQVPVPPKKKIEPVVSKPAIRKSKSKAKSFLGSFISEDVGDIKKHIIDDYVKPSSQDWIRNCLIFVVNAVFGGTGKAIQNGIGINYVDYSKKSNIRTQSSSGVRSIQRFDDIFVSTRGEAESVLESLRSQIEIYGIVSVADLNDMLNIPGHFTDEKYGWSNIDGAYIKPISYNKYLIVLPDASPIN